MNSRDLDRKLDAFGHYYNQHRVHQSLDGKTSIDAPEVNEGKQAARSDPSPRTVRFIDRAIEIVICIITAPFARDPESPTILKSWPRRTGREGDWSEVDDGDFYCCEADFTP
ncbi:hypothetical protein OAM69_06390 [bacterium]|nr:hypothetical protein [bacterium]